MVAIQQNCVLYTNYNAIILIALLDVLTLTKLSTSSFYRAAAGDVICLEAVVLPGGKTMECLYGNGRKFALFSLTSPAKVIGY